MATFAYTVKNAAGAVQEGSMDGEDQASVVRRLQEQGLSVVKIKAAKAPKPKTTGGFGKVKLADLSIFCRQFSTMVDAGVSLVRCLNVLGQQASSPKLKKVIQAVEGDVQSGQTLTKALAKHPSVFNNLFVGLVHAGEIGGALEDSLQRLSSFLEKDMEMKRKIKGAMTYPTIVMSVAILVVLGMVTFILPKFMQLFLDMGMKETDMPGLTRALMAFSHFLTGKWYFSIGATVAGVVAFKMIVRTKPGARAFDMFKLKAPVFGPLNHKVSISRFARTLATLLTSGVPILQALETVAGTVSNVIISDAIMSARDKIREGDEIGGPLERSKLFPPMVVQMISIGEESGALDQMLTKVAEFYEQEVNSAIEGLTSAIEPVMIVFLGGAVGFIVIAMFMPLTAIIGGLSSGSGDS
jgi:type IV pilus assembly protein PilC